MIALISVANKENIGNFASKLVQQGWDIVASGKTAAYLRENSIAVRDIEELTDFSEMMGGRVKTLHPAIHSGILAQDNYADMLELEAHGWNKIDLVVCNLYPFQEATLDSGISEEAAIEFIDVGGVALLRAAAKNFARVGVICDPDDYGEVLEMMETGQYDVVYRKRLANKAFHHTGSYDLAIANYFSAQSSVEIKGYQTCSLRYGENPHQSAAFYSSNPNQTPFGGKLLHGKELSYNNIMDIDSAWKVVNSFSEPCLAIIKHNSPCGIASHAVLRQAYEAALASDPVSAFGGIIAANVEIDEDTAHLITKLFVECVVAPKYSGESQKILARKKNLRLYEIPINNKAVQSEKEFRSVAGGFLLQDADYDDPGSECAWKIVTKKKPTDTEFDELRFAWKAVRHVKSNAVVLGQGTATVGIGGGQPNRIDSVRIALDRAGLRAKGSVMASDGFFPFSDSIETAYQSGVRAVIQPGGSLRDKEVIECANQHGLAMIFTGIRHFKH